MRDARGDTASASTRTLAEAWLTDVDVLTGRLLTAIFTDNPEWTDYEPVPRADLREGCKQYLTRILEILSGAAGGPDGDDVAASIGRHRAEQGVRLEVMLRTFRLGGRIVWEALLEQAELTGVAPHDVLEAGTAMWSVIDGLSSTLSTYYRNTELERVRLDEQRRHALIEDLLGGRAGDATFAARAASELNLPAGGGYVVVVADQAADGTPALSSPRATLSALRIFSVWQSRVDTEVGIVALENRPPAAVLDRLRPLARGRAGVSPPVASLTEIGTAHALAQVALGTSPKGAAEVVSLEQRYPEALLVRSPELAARMAGQVLGGVLARPEKERDVLLRTITAWLEENRSAANAAVRLHCHRNTVLNRLQRVAELIGRPLEGRKAYVELSLALSALDLPRDEEGPAPGA
ncbi:PucR family transcriptional regulator [Prauserella marina]|uniref:PucR C-terminal helix-turn-helix domain-containing protein n=1 Tax=Prauserella marina TaxID=530584 RepID=A0A222VQ35_9PSEU|nr:helix-turn-helix domain-containing protein [Prauserella marina]ASR36028.1 PucR family transcriptional regulator [Prauserella marina]PWV84021.1 PucR-like helix-turn-helix protein [Prauserella marina]SDC32279.1 PucR C-terminal helix-turn-helix domain-containing protein [Prauserella marina]